MVCQTAGQTRFRAFNHQIGISGSAAVVVKIIACYQPLLDCQAEYFRQLLKPTYWFKMNNYSAWKCVGNSMSLFPCREKKLMVFNQSEDCAFKSERFEISHPGVEVPFSNLATSEEMHEDSDEIDALLYSDSEEEEAASTGHSPAEQNMEEVASSLSVPGKRKRIDESNISMVAPASSAGAYYQAMVQGYGEEDAESSCEGGEEYCEDEDEGSERKRAKRERIMETVALLRQIIPGGHGKDAATVIDDAIRYLKSLKLQAMALEAASII